MREFFASLILSVNSTYGSKVVRCAFSWAFLLFGLTACNPMGGSQSKVDAGHMPGLPADGAIAKPILSYTGATGTSGSVGVAMSVSPTTLTSTAAVTACAVKAGTTALPGWATINASTCVISGTPTEALTATTFTIVATNSGGISDDASVQLSVGAIAPTSLVRQSPVGATGTDTTPTITVTGGDVASGVTVTLYSDSLCTLAVAGATGTASSTSINLTANALADDAYTFYANLESGGVTSSCSSASVVYQLDTTAPTWANSTAIAAATSTSTTTAPNGSYTANANDGTGVAGLIYQYSIGTSSGGIQVVGWTATGGTPFTPSGLTLPVGTTYYLNFRVVDALSNASSVYTRSWQVVSAPTISYAGAAGTNGTRGTAMSVTPTTLTTGASATISSCAITAGGSLPTGVTIHNTTCVISGTPTTLLASTSFTITVTNSYSQSTSATVSLSVDENLIDSDNTTYGFGGGTKVGVQWNTNSINKLILGPDTDCDGNMSEGETVYTNCAELDASWTPQWSSLVGYWKMDESSWNGTANEVLDSKGTNHGTSANGATTSSTTKNGSKAGIFDGSDDFVSLPIAASLSTASGTVAFWMKSASDTGRAVYAVTDSASGTGIIIGVGANITSHCSDELITIINGPSARFCYSTTNRSELFDGNWHYVVVTSTGTTKKFYIDGSSKTSTQGGVFDGFTANATSANGIGIGKNIMGSHLAATFSGSLDSMAVWNVALSDAEVQAIYDRQSAKYSGQFTSRVMNYGSSNAWDGLKWLTTLPFGKELMGDANNSGTITAADSETHANYPSLVGSTGSTTDDNLMSGLVGLWHMNESNWNGTASEVVDSSGNGNHGTRAGNATTSSLGVFQNTGTFDGTGDHITVPSSTSLNPANFISIAAWVKTNNSTQRYVTTNGQYYLAIGVNAGDGKFSLYTGLGPGWVYSNSVISDGKWHHIVATYDGSHMSLFLDGVADNTPVAATGAMAAGSTLYIGARSGSWEWNGNLDEVAIWNRALHADEIKQLYRRGANRIKYQVRTCTTSDCSDNPSWLGNDNTKASYFSELHNYAPYNFDVNNCSATNLILTGSPSLLFDCFTGALSNLTSQNYFQYRAILESDDASTNCNYGSGATWCSPELKSVEVKP